MTIDLYKDYRLLFVFYLFCISFFIIFFYTEFKCYVHGVVLNFKIFLFDFRV